MFLEQFAEIQSKPFSSVSSVSSVQLIDYMRNIVIFMFPPSARNANLSNTKSIEYQIYRIPNLSKSKCIEYQIYRIPNLSNTKSIECQIYRIPNLSNTKSIEYQIDRIPNRITFKGVRPPRGDPPKLISFSVRSKTPAKVSLF